MLLVVAAEEEEKLCLESVSFPVLIELAQEGVLLKDFQKQLGLKVGLHKAGQSGLAHPDGTLDCYVDSVHLLALLSLYQRGHPLSLLAMNYNKPIKPPA